MSAINLKIASRHEAARIADAEHCRTSVFLRHTQLAQHVLRWPVTPALGVFLKESFHHRRCDVPRRNGVDTDAVGTPLRGKVAAQLEDGGFGGVVGWADEALEDYCKQEVAKNRGWTFLLTRLATEPLMEAIIAMLPPLPQRIISFATA